MSEIKYQIKIEGCSGCPVYSFEEGFYHRCNHYDKYFDVKGISPEQLERPSFCKVKEIIIVEEGS